MEPETILNNRNMEIMVNWLTGEGIPCPDFAERFMTTLHLLYMNKSSGAVRLERRIRRAAPCTSSLSLRTIAGEEVAGLLMAAASAAKEGGRKDGGAVCSPEVEGTLSIEDAGYDSLVVARAATTLYTSIQKGLDRPRPLSMSFLQAVLYITYGIFLSNNNERIIKETPQMWRYGPVFAKVYRGLASGGEAGGHPGELERLSPSLLTILDRSIRRCIDLGMRHVTSLLTEEGSPWRRCLEAHPEGWGQRIDDGAISSWFSTHRI